MGRSIYGQLSGTDNKGQQFVTVASALEKTAATVVLQSQITSLQAIETAALTLETAVSSALAAATTGTSGAGSMDRNVKTTLSASYSSVTASIY